MLSEEEKKAIERLQERIKDNENYKTTQVWLTDDVVAVNTLLYLITKLQKENEEKDKQIKDLQSRKDNQEKRFKKYKENIDKQHEEIYENLVSEKEKYVYLYQKALRNTLSADKENLQLKKQINLMADKLVEAHKWFYSEFDNFTKEDFIKYFETKAKKGE